MIRVPTFAAALGLALAACGDSGDGGAERVAPGPDAAGMTASKEFALLSGPVPPDACAYLTDSRAADILGGPPTLRPGPGCAYAVDAAPHPAALRMLLTSYPLEVLDLERQSRAELAAALTDLAQIEAPLEDIGDVAGGPAFSLEEEGASRMFVLPGVRTTAAIGDRPVGEVVIAMRLENDRTHAERVAAMTYAAEDAASRLVVGGAAPE